MGEISIEEREREREREYGKREQGKYMQCNSQMVVGKS